MLIFPVFDNRHRTPVSPLARMGGYQFGLKRVFVYLAKLTGCQVCQVPAERGMNLILATDDARRAGDLRLIARRRAEHGVRSPSWRLVRGAIWPVPGAIPPILGISRATTGPTRDGTTFDRKTNQVTLSPEETAARIAALGQKRLVVHRREPLLQAGALAELAGVSARYIRRDRNHARSPRLSGSISGSISTMSAPKLAPFGQSRRPCPDSRAAGRMGHRPARFFSNFRDRRARGLWTRCWHCSAATGSGPGRFPDGRRHRQRHPASAAGMACSRSVMEHGFRMSDRLHIHLYGDTRGT